MNKIIKKNVFTHFISLPLNSPEIQLKFSELKSKICQENFTKFPYIEKIFAKKESLHLTILMLNLDTEIKKLASIEAFKLSESNIKSNILSPNQNFSLDISNLNYIPIRKFPQFGRVIYAEIGSAGQREILMKICDTLIKNMLKFNVIEETEFSHIHKSENGMMYPEKFHLTIMNTTFLKSKNIKKQGILAEPLLENYHNYNFGTMKINEMHISTRFKFNENGFYLPLAIMKL